MIGRQLCTSEGAHFGIIRGFVRHCVRWKATGPGGVGSDHKLGVYSWASQEIPQHLLPSEPSSGGFLDGVAKVHESRVIPNGLRGRRCVSSAYVGVGVCIYLGGQMCVYLYEYV